MTTARHILANGDFLQDWSNPGLITANDDWSGVPSIVGYRGDDIITSTGFDPRLIVAAATSAVVVDVNANQANPLTFNTGGVTEYDGIANPTIGFTGSGTADAPSIVIYLDATGESDIRFRANLRDLEASADDAQMQVAVQWRVGGGDWNNIFYDADVTTVNTATEVTAVDVTLPAGANGAADLEIRVITTNAVGNDENVGIDDIIVSSGGGGGDVTPPTLVDTTPDDGASGVAAGANIILVFSEAVVAGTGSFTISNGSDTRTISVTDGQVTITGNTVTINPTADLISGSMYTVTAAAGILEDAAGNDFDGLQTGELDFTVGAAPVVTREIGEVQGLGHSSPFLNQQVRVEGVVTAVDTTGGRGFYIQSTDQGDGDSRTSEGLFVFTNAAPTVVVGDLVGVTGTVTEFLPGGNANNLTITQLTLPTIDLLGTATVVPILLGQGGLLPPTEIIDNDSFAVYDPAQDGIDFYESIEGQLVTVQQAQVAGFTGAFSEAWVLTDNGANATGVNARRGITISEGDFNPERIQLDNDSGLTGGTNPFGASLSQGDRLGDVNAVVRYDFGQYEFAVTQIVTPIEDVTLAKEVTALPAGDADTLAIASYNLLNIDALDPQVKFDILAQDIIVNLKAPAIIALQEVQDADGEGAGANLSGEPSIARLIEAITLAGGPAYTYVEIAPDVANTNGGAPNANIRNGYLYQDTIVDLVPNSLELVDPGNPAFNNSRKPLAAEWIYNGQSFTTVNVHSSSRSGSESLFGSNQPPVNAAEGARIAQATVIRDYVDGVTTADPGAKVVVLGDFNGFLFEQPFDILTAGDKLSNLQELLPEEERYTFQFDGNNQAIDHLLVTQNLLAGAQFDTVALNAERFGLAGVTSGSDHDAIVALLDFTPPPPVEINGTSRADTIVGGAGADVINGRAGADKLFGNGGNDTINGGDGADVIQGGAGTNTLNGGAFSDRFAGEAVDGVHIIDGEAGVDTFMVNSAGEAVTVDLAAGTVTGGYADGSTLVNVEAIAAIVGLAADITLLGDARVNTLTGGNGADVLDGRAGNDRLFGGGGPDQLTGGLGNDRFVFRPGEVAGDAVLDFDGRGTAFGDVLQFAGFGPDATLSNVGNLFTVTYDGGTATESFTLNVTSLAAGDVVFTG